MANPTQNPTQSSKDSHNIASLLGDIGTSEEQVELLDIATNFCRTRSSPDKARSYLGKDEGYDKALWQEMAELGWMAIFIDQKYGGVGLSMAEAVPIAEQMGRHLLSTPYISTLLAIEVLNAGGHDDQRAKWLPRLATGMPATIAALEAHGQWGIGAATANTAKEGDKIKLFGEKRLVQWADDAKLIIATIMHDGKLNFALLQSEDIGTERLRKETVIDEMTRSYTLDLNDIIIEENALIPAEKAHDAAIGLARARALLSTAELCGCAQACLDLTIDYLQTRTQFGKVIGGFQALKHPTVDNYVEYEKIRTLLYSAAHMWGKPGVQDAAIHMAASRTHYTASSIGDRAIQFHGAFGFTHECDAQLYRRKAIMTGALIGDAAFHRTELSNLLFK